MVNNELNREVGNENNCMNRLKVIPVWDWEMGTMCTGLRIAHYQFRITSHTFQSNAVSKCLLVIVHSKLNNTIGTLSLVWTIGSWIPSLYLVIPDIQFLQQGKDSKDYNWSLQTGLTKPASVEKLALKYNMQTRLGITELHFSFSDNIFQKLKILILN